MGRQGYESTPQGIDPERPGGDIIEKGKGDAGQVRPGQEAGGKTGLMFFLVREARKVDDEIRAVAAAKEVGGPDWQFRGSMEDELARQRRQQAEKASRLNQLQARLGRFNVAQSSLLGDDKGPALEILTELITAFETEWQTAGEAAQKQIAEIREREPGDAQDADLWSQEIVRYSKMLEDIDRRPVTQAAIDKILTIARANFNGTKIGLALRPARELEERLNRLKRLRDSLS